MECALDTVEVACVKYLGVQHMHLAALGKLVFQVGALNMEEVIDVKWVAAQSWKRRLVLSIIIHIRNKECVRMRRDI